MIVGLDPTASSRAAQHSALERGIRSRLLSQIHSENSSKESADKYDALIQPEMRDSSAPISGCSFDYRVHVPEVHVSSKFDCPMTSFRFSKGFGDLMNCTSNSESESALNCVPPSDEHISLTISSDTAISPNSDRNIGISGKNGSSKIIKKVPPCGTSLNWVQDVFNSSDLTDGIEKQRKRLKFCNGGSVEVTVADTGVLQGL